MAAAPFCARWWSDEVRATPTTVGKPSTGFLVLRSITGSLWTASFDMPRGQALAHPFEARHSLQRTPDRGCDSNAVW
eukprot:2852759-Pyramimonas_sp.AAC.1